MASWGRSEQKHIKFKRGMYVEMDECAVRVESVKCAPQCQECKDQKGKPNCVGYRLLWNRWIILVQRGNRENMVLHQLPWKTSHAEGGGVPLSGDEMDAILPKYLGKGVICLTDGASAYEAVTCGNIQCAADCRRLDCAKKPNGFCIFFKTSKYQSSPEIMDIE